MVLHFLTQMLIPFLYRYHYFTMDVFKCKFCPKTFSTQKGCARHESTVHREKNFRCPQCPRKYLDANALKRHLAKDHPDPAAPASEDDGMEDETTSDPDSTAADQPKAYPCALWDACFTTVQSLSEHKKQKHNDRRIICALCKKSFPDSQGLKDHEKFFHSPNIYPCIGCHPEFSKGYLLVKYEKTCDGSPRGPGMDATYDDNIANRGISGQAADINPNTAIDEYSEEEGDGEDRVGAAGLVHLKSLFSPEEQALHEENLGAIRSAIGLFLHNDLPETPTPAQQLVMGHNMKRFEVAQLVEPSPTIPPKNGAASANLSKFVKQPARRKLWALYSFSDKHSTAITVRVQDYEGRAPGACKMSISTLTSDTSCSTKRLLIAWRLHFGRSFSGFQPHFEAYLSIIVDGLRTPLIISCQLKTPIARFSLISLS